jgi:hypothetical protein
MNSEARMKWDAEKAFAQIEGAEHFHKKTGDRPFLVLEDARAMRQPYTPPSNITPERLAQLKRYEPVKHKGRDYEALTKAALKKPVGFWEDAPRGQAFTGVGNGSCPKTDATASKQGVAPLAPTPSTEELYEPVGTMPVVGDKVIVLEADGTPYNGDDAGKPQEVLSVHSRECVTGYCELKMEYFCAPHPICKIQNRILKRTQAKTQAPDDVATGRAWKCEGPDACYSWLAKGWALFGAGKG